MKRIVLTSAIILGLAAPAFAGSQLENSVGVEAGVYSLSQLVTLKDAAEETGNEGNVFFGDNSRVSSKGVGVANAASQLEKTLGVAAGAFSIAELGLIKDAAEQTDNEGKIYLGDRNFSTTHDAIVAAFAASVIEQDRDDD